MSVNSTERTTRLHDLDLQYQESRHKTDLINRDEDARRLQLHVLLLQDENAQLQDKCAAKDAEIKTLSSNNDKLRVQLDDVKAQKHSQDAQSEGSAVGGTGATTGVEPFETPMHDLSKALEENIALTKELQQLRPEMELLRLQVTNYEKMISEQRAPQENSETEIPNKKKRNSKSEKLNGESGDIAELQSKLDKTTEQIAEGERQRERMEVEYQKKLDESQRQKVKLEAQVSTFEKKLKDSQKELREVREALQASRSQLKENKSEDGNTFNKEPTARHKIEQSPTAEKERLPHKKTARKRAAELAMIGEKSTFSITPLLNRTKDLDTAGETTGLGLALDEVLAQTEHDIPSPIQMASKPNTQSTTASNVELAASASAKPQEKAKLKSLGGQLKSKRKGLDSDESSASKFAVTNQDIEKLISEDTEEKETAPHRRIKLHETSVSDRGSEFEQKKRKRKLLSKTTNTIIEEDETGDVVPPMETQPGRARKLKSTAGNALNSGSTEKPFSPLKRHRRGVNASFLV